MAAYDDVLDLQMLYRVVHHRHDIEIHVWHEIGDIPVDKNLARLQTHNLIGGAAAIATADVPGFN